MFVKLYYCSQGMSNTLITDLIFPVEMITTTTTYILNLNGQGTNLKFFAVEKKVVSLTTEKKN